MGNGNPITYGGTSLTFDPENRMTAHGSVLTAGYSGDGFRAWKQNASGRTYFLYDGIFPVLEMHSSGGVAATNSFGAAGLVSRRAGTTSVFYSFDSQGDVSQKSDVSGSVLSNYLFSAHGSILSGALGDPFGYKAQFGYYTDTETGFQLLTHRYYDPITGRFLTRDPISYTGGTNLYAYVTNNPVNFLDPTGTQVRSDRNFRPGEIPSRRTTPISVPQQPSIGVRRRAMESIADATGSRLNPNWSMSPGGISYDGAVDNLRRIGFKQFFNPNPLHVGGSDWEGGIEGNWYHVTLGYPTAIKYPGFFQLPPAACYPSFVEAHRESSQPSSLQHLIDYLGSWF